MSTLNLKAMTIGYSLLMLVIGAASLQPAYAGGLRCGSNNPSLSLKTATTTTKYIRSKSSADLTQLHGGSGAAVGGLGGGETGFKVENSYQVETLGNQACVKLDRVEVTFYAKPEIHIASNFSRNSCEYAAVMAHEKGHIRILRKFVREFSPKAKQHVLDMLRRFDTAKLVNISQVETTQNQMQKEFLGQLGSYNDKIMKILSKRQQAHDSPKEYANVASKCKSWDEKLADK